MKNTRIKIYKTFYHIDDDYNDYDNCIDHYIGFGNRKAYFRWIDRKQFGIVLREKKPL